MDDNRLLLSDETWERIERALKAVKHPAGVEPDLPDRDFVEAVLYLARAGCPWRDLPECFGKWNSVYQRFRRWHKAGYWAAIFVIIPGELADVERLLLDSTTVRAHPHAAGAPKATGGQEAQGLGRSRGGFTSKLHIAAADENTPVAIVLTPGQVHDAAAFDELKQAVPPDCHPKEAVADKGYDSDKIRDALVDEGIKPVIPHRKNAVDPPRLDKKAYRERNRVERLISKLKQFRRIATRYDKLGATFMAFVQITAVLIMCR